MVYHHDPRSGCPSPIMNVTINNVAQGIVFINERPPGYTSNCLGDYWHYTGIGICDVKVMGKHFMQIIHFITRKENKLIAFS